MFLVIILPSVYFFSLFFDFSALYSAFLTIFCLPENIIQNRLYQLTCSNFIFKGIIIPLTIRKKTLFMICFYLNFVRWSSRVSSKRLQLPYIVTIKYCKIVKGIAKTFQILNKLSGWFCDNWHSTISISGFRGVRGLEPPFSWGRSLHLNGSI